MPFFILLIPVITIFSLAPSANAVTSRTLNFQGRLLSNTGTLVPDGSYNIEFKIYDDDLVGVNHWTETRGGGSAVTVQNGYFSVYLGEVTPFGASIPWDQELWMTMNVNGDGEMTPRFKLTSVPYAFRAGALVDASGNAKTADDFAQLSPASVQTVNTAIAALRLNQTGAGSLLQLQGNGSNVFTVDKSGNTVAFGAQDVRGASVTVGTISQTGSLILNDGSTNTATIQSAALGQDVVYTLPDPGQATATICLSTGNCAGGGDILQNGNTLGADIVIGTNDANDLVLETGGAERLRITDTGGVSIVGGLNLNDNLVIGDTNADRITLNSQILGATPLVFQGVTDNGFTTGFVITDPTANQTITFPDLSGTVALLENSQTFSGLKTFGAGLTVTASQNLTVNGDVITDLTGSGLTISGSSLAVSFGSSAGTAVQGNVTLVCPSGSGNLSGGGDTITLGSGGSCSNIGISNSPTFTTSVTSPTFTGSGAVTVSSGGAGNLTLDSASNIVILSDQTLRRAASGTTYLELNDTANTTFSITNTDGTALANLSVEGSISATSLSGNGSGLTSLDATNISSGTVGDSYLSANVVMLGGSQSLSGLKTFGAGLTITSGQNFTIGGDTITDLTGSGLVLSGTALTVDATSATGFIRNGGNTLAGGLMTIGTGDANGISFITAGSNKLSILSGGNVGINNSNPDNKLNINTPTTTVTATEAVITSTTATNRGLVIQGATSQSELLLALQSSTGTQLSGFNSSGGLVLGLTTFSSTATSTRAINLPDAAGTVCLSNTDACGFVRLASGSVQTNGSANNTIDINKTNATGDLVLLKKNGSAVFTVANSGALQIQSTDVAALDIRNASGTSYFSVDTSTGVVRVGPTAADGTGVLFVLDTKNNAGDPTGIDGGQYYNSSTGKFRCYENSIWKDCVSTNQLRSFVDSTSDAAVDANTTNYWDTAAENNNATPNIVLSSASGKAVMGTVTMEITSTGNNDSEVSSRIERGVGSVPTCGSGTTVGGRPGVFTTNTASVQSSTITFIDTPNTVSTVYYVLCSDSTTNGITANVTRIRITLQEAVNTN